MSCFRLYLILAFFNQLETAEKNTANKRTDMTNDTAACIVYARISDLSLRSRHSTKNIWEVVWHHTPMAVFSDWRWEHYMSCLCCDQTLHITGLISKQQSLASQPSRSDTLASQQGKTNESFGTKRRQSRNLLSSGHCSQLTARWENNDANKKS